MIRVPGSRGSLQNARAEGADVRIVYSPTDAVKLAKKNSGRPVIFLGVGFETTAPGVAASILEAEGDRLKNYFILSLHKFTPPATRAILDSGGLNLSGILGPGHVTTIIGTDAWRFLLEDYRVPMAVAGFEPLDILQGISMLVDQIRDGRARVDNAYSRGVLPQGNPTARAIMNRVFKVCDAEWRGIGIIPESGMSIRDDYAAFDASRAFRIDVTPGQEPSGCRCGDVLRGIISPLQCPLFQGTCTPESPIGPCMVSTEGTCAAYYQFGEKDLED
jgi:hydrogenase expression/formation protein HypD